jgi:predicted transcriptional regulator
MVVNNKQAALKIIEQMPDDVSLEDIMYELYFRRRVDRGLKESEEGKLIPHDEVMREMVECTRTDDHSRYK